MFSGISGALIEDNTAPSMDLIGPRTLQENSSFSFLVTAVDSENDVLYYSSSDLPEGAHLENTSGLFEWTPDYNQSGKYQVEFIVSDGEYNDSEYVELTVLNTNRPPELQPIPEYTVNESEYLEISLLASDPDNDILEFSKSIEFGSISDNKFVWTPSHSSSGNHLIDFSVSDGVDATHQYASVKVLDVNRPPVLFSISDRTSPANEVVEFYLDAFDPDNDELTYSSVSTLPAGATLDNGSGHFYWVPDINDTGEHILEFMADDGIDLSETRHMIIFVGSISSPPLFDTIGPKHVPENTSISFGVNATDDDGDKISYSMVLSPEGSDFSSSLLLFEWTPSYDQAGVHLAEFMASEPHSSRRFRSFETVLIDVSDVNREPEMGFIRNYVINETETLLIDINATDADDDSLNYSTNVSFGRFIGNTFIWTPDYLDRGEYDVEFSVCDGINSASRSATIYVEKKNMPPELLTVGSREIVLNDTLEFTLGAFDGDGDTLSYAATGLPQGSSFDTASYTFVWTPSADQKGNHTVGFQVSDGEFTDYETILITVKESVVDDPVPSSPSGGGSSGGSSGGGGSMNTGEKFENIAFKDYVLKSVMKEKETVFQFAEADNPIDSITLITSLNFGQVKAVTEILKETSSLVTEYPPGTIYKNINIWMGDSKFSQDAIDGASIRFKIEKAWIQDNAVQLEDISLCRYSEGSWEHLDTMVDGEDNIHVYFLAKTPGFSPFAIVEFDLTESISQDDTLKSDPEDIIIEEVPAPDPAEKQESSFSLLHLMTVAGILCISIIGKMYREDVDRVRSHLSNNDGKRYRRLRK